ncbi:MAG TPA: hypothetical protein VJL58_10165 [Pyrinomonadaceae bacterium]|nr:hypothetical protein [Pyrinomonadaceae bacterium]
MKILLTICLLTVIALPQKVEVDQGFVDDANRAFIEVVALRRLVTALDGQVKAEQSAKVATEAALAAQKELAETLKAENKRLREITCTKSSFLLFVWRSKKCF